MTDKKNEREGIVDLGEIIDYTKSLEENQKIYREKYKEVHGVYPSWIQDPESKSEMPADLT